jgi:glycosyltransferase involved in cell wall biosynthesis
LANRVVGVSKDIAELAAQSGIRRDRIAAIWNGIDVEKFPYCGPAACGPAILVARLAPEKDISTLLRATSLVAEQVPEFTLRLVGDGPCRPSLEALATELKIRSRVEFVGQAIDVRQQLRQASMFVLPSLSEGVSLSLLEAMATGLPVIATRVGGNVEVVEHGKTGFLVPPADPSEMAEAILRLAKDPALGRCIGVAGRMRCENAFNVRGMIRAYEELYCECLSKRDGSTREAPPEANSLRSASPDN